MDLIGGIVGMVKDLTGIGKDITLLKQKLDLNINKAKALIKEFKQKNHKLGMTGEYLQNRIEDAEAKATELGEMLHSSQSGNMSL